MFRHTYIIITLCLFHTILLRPTAIFSEMGMLRQRYIYVTVIRIVNENMKM